MDWAGEERVAARRASESARTRLQRLGAMALTDEELVTLVAGAKEPSALLGGGLKGLCIEPPENLLEHPALPDGGAHRLLAALELGRRAALTEESRPRLGSPQTIYDYARRHMLGLRREEFHVLCFSSRNVLLKHARVAEGSIDQCHIDPREALGPAIACRASGIVLLHNHPSGDPEPSVLDVSLTRQLRDGARLLCIKLLDHLVVGDRGFVSMLARGLLGEDDGRPWHTRLQEG